MRAAKDLHFNKNMEALKKMQAGADKLATVVGVTLGPKVRPLASTAAQPMQQQQRCILTSMADGVLHQQQQLVVPYGSFQEVPACVTPPPPTHTP